MTHVPASVARKTVADGALRIFALPLCLLRASRRRFRAYLAFSRIDNHTLDDLGLRRTIFTAAPTSDNMGGFTGSVRYSDIGCR